MKCPQCRLDSLAGSKFCGECGSVLQSHEGADVLSLGGRAERKHVTILFSDLSGYTRLCDSVDPEHVKAIMGKIFAEGARIVHKYSGAVERFFGDEILAIFGSPIAHEDDAIRAIRVATEIHAAVKILDTQLRDRIGLPLAMHTGINTGVVVTDIGSSEDPFSDGITGDAVNVAKRLQGLARPGDILIGPETYHQTAGYFSFQVLESQHLKGKAEPMPAYRLIAPKSVPRKVHRTYGRRAELIGRTEALEALKTAAIRARDSAGSVFCISGAVGTGKSRLIEDFRDSLNPEVFHWCEGFAYPYAQNISYFPFIDLLRREFQILEEDPPETIQKKVEAGIATYVSDSNVAGYVGGLFALEYPRGETDPEHWKTRLQEAICLYFSSLAGKQPLIVCLEDLHWSDPSSLDLIRAVLLNCNYPALFLLVYRTPFEKLQQRVLAGIEMSSNSVELQDLSLPDTWKMIRSLLKAEEVPTGLKQFIEENTQGNPFYLEEVINSLIESGTLVVSGGAWTMTRPIAQSGVALTIRGLITGRLDRLKPELREVLREASVLGSSFQVDVLAQISSAGAQLRHHLHELVGLDIIRLCSTPPNEEYCFRHVLTREVVYDGLLRSERQAIHGRIGHVIEGLFHGRLAEYCETLAFHFKEARSFHKAVEYLMQSGRKSLRRYAVEESHEFYKEAHDILANQGLESAAERRLLIEVLVYWVPVYYYRGQFRDLQGLLNAHLELAETVDDEELRGMYCLSVGVCLWARESFRDSYQYLHKALQIGKDVDSKRVQGYARAWLAWTCVELGFLDEALEHGDASREMADHFESDHYPYFQAWDSDGYAYWAMGHSSKTRDCGQALLQYGLRHSSVRGITWGHSVSAWGHLAAGDLPAAIDCNQRAVKASADPFYAMFPRLALGMCRVLARDFKAAKAPLLEVSEHARLHGSEILGSVADLFSSAILLFEGKLARGVARATARHRAWEQQGARWRQINAELLLAESYLGMIRRDVPVTLSTIVRNAVFLLRARPLAAQKAEYYYRRALQNAESIGAKGIQGQAYLGMSLLYQAIGRPAKARVCVEAAIDTFRQCDAAGFVQLAETARTQLSDC